MDIVNLIETNPITKFSGNYQSRLVEKLRGSFTETQQQLFLANFYCYLNCSKTEFVVDLDDVWGWMGFHDKATAKRCLVKHFVADKDYMGLLGSKAEQTNGRGGGNKQVFKLTVPAFKRFCLKAGTAKADEIHEYYIRLEEVIQETICEESAELQRQLTATHETHETEKCELREKTILDQFPNNTQCFYYGTIANTSADNEPLVKFGMSNDLRTRRKAHRSTYRDFQLVNAFRVSNKTEMENAFKTDPDMAPRIRAITVKHRAYTELIAIDDMSFAHLDREIKRVISEVEYNKENYTKLRATVATLRAQLDEANATNYRDQYYAGLAECKRLREEHRIISKMYNDRTRQNRSNHPDHPQPPTPPILQQTNVIATAKRTTHDDGSRTINGTNYRKTVGDREEVFAGVAYNTTGRLRKEDLMRNHHGKIVSVRKSIRETQQDRFVAFGVNPGPNP
jgi:hypothetical protein